ncbi:hypothetical protein ACS5PN_03765 [Roseateles sp. NT4]|uniref:hypothetical protein n=1 Tax=Roseateles sp. NT4 TaxID=3453715 RepID=UPI003EE94882
MKNLSKTSSATPQDTKAGRNPGARPGVAMRGALAAVYELRGHTQGKLWTQYSGKSRADVAFATEIAYLHFLYVESSFDVVSVDYSPAFKITRAVGESFVDLVDAELVMANGDVIWRKVCDDDRERDFLQAQRQLDVLLKHVRMPDGLRTPRLQTLTHSQMLVNPERIRNWHGIASWLSAGRDWELSEFQIPVSALIRREGRAEFQQVLALGGGTDQDDLYGVALLEALQRGAYRSNLYDAPFTMRSVFSATRGAA